MESVVKSKRKAIKDLALLKVVNISDYRELRQGKEQRSLALISDRSDLYEGLKAALPEFIEFERFDSRFSFEQALKAREWSGVLLDERSLKDDAIQLCEKIKRQNKMDDLVIFILSESADKDSVRKGLEKGCDEWVTKLDDHSGIIRLLSHHIDFDA